MKRKGSRRCPWQNGLLWVLCGCIHPGRRAFATATRTTHRGVVDFSPVMSQRSSQIQESQMPELYHQYHGVGDHFLSRRGAQVAGLDIVRSLLPGLVSLKPEWHCYEEDRETDHRTLDFDYFLFDRGYSYETWIADLLLGLRIYGQYFDPNCFVFVSHCMSIVVEVFQPPAPF